MALKAGVRVVVAGAGVVGAVVALTLARMGAAVTLLDPAAPGDNASGVAAGMLAPAMEAALDPAASDHFELLMAARDAWEPLAEQTGVALDRSGALAVGGSERLEGVARRLAALGAPFERRSEGVFTSLDWRLDADLALVRLIEVGRAAGVHWMAGALAHFEAGVVHLVDGRRLEAEHLVLATGAATWAFAPQTAHLTPIKGHILRFPPHMAPGPVVRGEGVYLCPSSHGLVVGASMEPGAGDRLIDPARVEALRAAAVQLLPALADIVPKPAAGVRAATPDGLPLVGQSATPGVILAAGMRRNGWLLAPLAARIVAGLVAGEDPGPWAGSTAPGRFD